jgi:thymidylate kinase
MLRDCVVLAVEGTHASGKTTLTHALAAYYRERGIHVATVEEPARPSPFIEEIVVHGKSTCGLEIEVDLFAAQLSAQLRAGRQHPVIICDKTIANVLAYAWLVLERHRRPRRRARPVPGRGGGVAGTGATPGQPPALSDRSAQNR